MGQWCRWVTLSSEIDDDAARRRWAYSLGLTDVRPGTKYDQWRKAREAALKGVEGRP